MAGGEAYEEVLLYWLGGSEPGTDELRRRLQLWFRADPNVDAEIATRFGTLIAQASAGELRQWAHISRGRLALILLLDQFRRNVYRGSKEAFVADGLALTLCREGIAAAMDTELSIIECAFFYMPMQHVEDLAAQQQGVEVFRRLVAESAPAIRSCVAEFHSSAVQHQSIIARFGRFPHRNAVLDRSSTAAELAYLLRERIPFRK